MVRERGRRRAGAGDGVRLLALDTASEWCSVALWQEGEISSRESRAERGHGNQVLSFIDDLLVGAGLRLGSLDALAFGRGPGAFTGLRLAASVTQGLAFAAGLPVIPVSDLRALAQQALIDAIGSNRVLVCHDARMGEVYWAGFESRDGYASPETAEQVAVPQNMLKSAREWIGERAALGAGSGFAAFPALKALNLPVLPAHAGIHPRAREIALLAVHDGLERAVPPEQAVPAYVRDNVAVAPANTGS